MLPLNMLNEKIYIVIWFWLIILTILTSVHVSSLYSSQSLNTQIKKRGQKQKNSFLLYKPQRGGKDKTYYFFNYLIYFIIFLYQIPGKESDLFVRPFADDHFYIDFVYHKSKFQNGPIIFISSLRRSLTHNLESV